MDKIITSLLFGKPFEKYKLLTSIYTLLMSLWVTSYWVKSQLNYKMTIGNFNTFIDEIVTKFTDVNIISGFFFFVFIFCVFTFWSQIFMKLAIYPIVMLVANLFSQILAIVKKFVRFIFRRGKSKNDGIPFFIYCLIELSCIIKDETGIYTEGKNYPRFLSLLKYINKEDFLSGVYKGANTILATIIVFRLYSLDATLHIPFILLIFAFSYYILECCAFIWINKRSVSELKIKLDELN